jgi:hypothetical protein
MSYPMIGQRFFLSQVFLAPGAEDGHGCASFLSV